MNFVFNFKRKLRAIKQQSLEFTLFKTVSIKNKNFEIGVFSFPKWSFSIQVFLLEDECQYHELSTFIFLSPVIFILLAEAQSGPPQTSKIENFVTILKY